MSEINQYQAPQSQVEGSGTQRFGEVKIFGVSGRIGRLRFLAYVIGINLLVGIPFNILQFILTMAMAVQAEFAIIGLAILAGLTQLVFYFMFAIQRAHDMNSSGWLSLILLIPLIGFLIFLFAPGTQGENRYGPPPPPNSGGVIALSVIGGLMVLIAFIGILAAIAIPAYQGYLEQAQQYEQSR